MNRAFLEKVARRRRRQIVLPERPLRPRADPAARRRGAHRHHGGGEGDQPKVVKQAEILDGVGMESAPHLKGYVRFTSRPTSDTILMADREDPLLVRWQYGLGRAAVFTSDAKNRWAANWVQWPGFDKLLGQHLPRPAAARRAERDHGRFRPRQRRTGGGLPSVAQRRGTRQASRTFSPSGPNGFQRAAEGGQGGGRTLSRPSRHRAESGTLPRAPAGRFARLPRGRLLPAGRRDAGVRQQRPAAAPDRGVHRRTLQPVRRPTSSTPPAAASAPPWNCGRDCWRWRSC